MYSKACEKGIREWEVDLCYDISTEQIMRQVGSTCTCEAAVCGQTGNNSGALGP